MAACSSRSCHSGPDLSRPGRRRPAVAREPRPTLRLFSLLSLFEFVAAGEIYGALIDKSISIAGWCGLTVGAAGGPTPDREPGSLGGSARRCEHSHIAVCLNVRITTAGECGATPALGCGGDN